MNENPSPIDWEALEFLTPEEAAASAGVQVDQLRSLVSGNHLPVFRIAGQMRFERREIEAYAAAADSPGLASLARVRRARARGIMMVERRLPFDTRDTVQNRYVFTSKHMPPNVTASLTFTPPRKREPQQLLTPEEVAKKLKVAYATLLRLLHGGDIAFHKVGSLIRIDPTDVERCLASVRHEVWVR